MAENRKVKKVNSFVLKEEDDDNDDSTGSKFLADPPNCDPDYPDVQEKVFEFGTTNDDSCSDDESGREPHHGDVIKLQKTSSNMQRATLAAVTIGDDTSNNTIMESYKASKPYIKRRVLKSLSNDIIKVFDVENDNKGSFIKKGRIAFQGDLSERLTKASAIGSKMIPKIIFPAAPKLFRDAWVMVELLLTIVQFVYAFFSTDYRINRLYNALYIILSTVNLVLALIDSFYYFYELGSCMVLYRRCKKRMKRRKKLLAHPDYESLQNASDSSDDSDIDDEEMLSISKMQSSPHCKFCHLSPENKEKLNMWFELIRNILSELLLYPLVVMDLFGLISDPDIEDKVNFAFFLIGSFYLVLSVYIARVVISVLTLLTMKNLLSATESGKKNVFFIIRFLFHSIGQVLVHLCCVIAVGIKIKQENDHNDGHFHASPIVWLAIFGGWFIPFIGVISYFIINYFWTQQFSVGFFIQLVSLLQEGDVVGSLMQSKSEMQTEAEERADKILEKMEFKEIKEEFKEHTQKNQIMKLFYPVKLPLFIGLCIVYTMALGGFFAVLLLTSKHGDIVPIDLHNNEGISLLVLISVIALANIHIIVVSNATIALLLLVLVLFISAPGFITVPLTILLVVIYRRFHSKSPSSAADCGPPATLGKENKD